MRLTRTAVKLSFAAVKMSLSSRAAIVYRIVVTFFVHVFYRGRAANAQIREVIIRRREAIVRVRAANVLFVFSIPFRKGAHLQEG